MKTFRTLLALLALAASTWAHAAPTPFAGSLSAGDPTFNRALAGTPPVALSGVGTAVTYDVYAFHVTVTTNYILETLSAALSNGTSDDTFMMLYANSFNAATPLLNAMVADDDGGAGFLSMINASLNTGTNYFLVVSSFGNAQFGNYTGQISSATGGGEAVLDDGTAVPEPSMLLLVPLALAGAALARRRKA